MSEAGSVNEEEGEVKSNLNSSRGSQMIHRRSCVFRLDCSQFRPVNDYIKGYSPGLFS